jgi:uncharacterized protein (TIGR02001 family)
VVSKSKATKVNSFQGFEKFIEAGIIMGMSSHRKIFHLRSTLCILTIVFAQSALCEVASNKLYGEAAIVSNYVDKGITQSDKGPALQAGFGYRMGPQARLGIWGSSVKFPDGDENLNLRLYFDVKVDFTTNTNLVLRYDFNRYFQGDTHNGNLLTLDLDTFTYHVMAEMNSNWEATQTSATWFGFRKEYSLSRGFVLNPGLGYTQLSATGYTNYFDARLGVGYKLADILYELAMTYNSNSSQFSGRGNMFFLLAINAKF